MAALDITAVAMDDSSGGDDIRVGVPSTSPVQINREFVTKAAYAEVVEGYIKDSFTSQAALHALGDTRTPPSYDELSQADSAAPTGQLLLCAAFKVDSDNFYGVLGLSRLEGPAPTRKKIEDRGQMGRELLELGSSALLEQQFLDMLKKWGQKIKDAVAHCCLDLGDALEARKAIKGEPKSLDQWKERAGPRMPAPST